MLVRPLTASMASFPTLSKRCAVAVHRHDVADNGALGLAVGTGAGVQAFASLAGGFSLSQRLVANPQAGPLGKYLLPKEEFWQKGPQHHAACRKQSRDSLLWR